MKHEFSVVQGLQRQRGLSLIELMVALLIAGLLGIGIMQVFGGTRLAFNSNVALARAQENARYALDFINHDLRMAGHLGTRNEQSGPPGQAEDYFSNYLLNQMAAPGTDSGSRRPSSAPWIYRLDVPFQAYEFNGTGMGATANLSAAPQFANTAADWTPALPNDLAAVLAATGGSNTGRALRNSDILVIRYLSGQFVRVGGTAAFDKDSGVFFWSSEDFPDFIKAGGVYAFSDIDAVNLFRVSAVSPDANASNEKTATATGTLPWNNLSAGPRGESEAGGLLARFTPGGSTAIHRYELLVYYVGLGSDGGPALFRRSLSADGQSLGPAEEMVPGVESLQVTLGVVNTNPRMSDQPTAYLTANAVQTCSWGVGTADACWRSVVNARVGLLMRAQQLGAEASNRFYYVGGTNFRSAADDRHIRHVHETQVSFRNRSRG